MNYLVLALVWSAYLALHSALISITVTGFFKRVLGEHYRFYRLFYNIVAIITLIPVILYSRYVSDPVFFAWDGAFIIAKILLLGTGILLFVAGSMHYSFPRFLGIRQIQEGSRHNLMNRSGRLNASGIHGLIRHPYYAGVIPLFWSADLGYAQLIINVIVTVYVIIGTYLEERKLIIEFGDAYREYQRKVSMFLPLKWIRSKFEGEYSAG